MRWGTIGLCVLSLVTLTGCPDDFGKGGQIDRAVFKDMMESVQETCPPEVFDVVCTNGKEHTEECRKACGR